MEQLERIADECRPRETEDAVRVAHRNARTVRSVPAKSDDNHPAPRLAQPPAHIPYSSDSAQEAFLHDVLERAPAISAEIEAMRASLHAIRDALPICLKDDSAERERAS